MTHFIAVASNAHAVYNRTQRYQNLWDLRRFPNPEPKPRAVFATSPSSLHRRRPEPFRMHRSLHHPFQETRPEGCNISESESARDPPSLGYILQNMSVVHRDAFSVSMSRGLSTNGKVGRYATEIMVQIRRRKSVIGGEFRYAVTTIASWVTMVCMHSRD